MSPENLGYNPDEVVDAINAQGGRINNPDMAHDIANLAKNSADKINNEQAAIPIRDGTVGKLVDRLTGRVKRAEERVANEEIKRAQEIIKKFENEYYTLDWQPVGQGESQWEATLRTGDKISILLVDSSQGGQRLSSVRLQLNQENDPYRTEEHTDGQTVSQMENFNGVEFVFSEREDAIDSKGDSQYGLHLERAQLSYVGGEGVESRQSMWALEPTRDSGQTGFSVESAAVHDLYRSTEVGKYLDHLPENLRPYSEKIVA